MQHWAGLRHQTVNWILAHTSPNLISMKTKFMAVAAGVVIPATGALFGGWAVVTIENPPEQLTAGVPYTLEYSVRQHGVELQSGLRGRVEATLRGQTVRADARAASGAGRYVATFTLPSPGEWTVTVHSGFGPAKTTMAPLTVGLPGAPVVALSAAARGQQLFAAKGCATCHVEMKVIPTDVRATKYDEQFVRKLLADPKSMPKRHGVDVEMPNLMLQQAEISALAAYLAGPNPAGTR